MAWLLSLAFLLTIASVPLLQHCVEIRAHLRARRVEIARDGAPQTPILPRSYDVLQELPTLSQLRAVRSPADAWKLVPDAARFREHEDALQNDSAVVQWLLPPLQNSLIGVGVGNEQAYCGRVLNGRQWLHYRPDVDYVTSRGFLDPALQKVRRRSGAESDGAAVSPDPVRAIVDFQQQLARRGIALIVMPTPVKTLMQPETLSNRYRFGQGGLQNPSFERFKALLSRQGVAVFDVSGPIWEQMRRTRTPQYLETDTHWTPAAMELSARAVAGEIEKRLKRPIAPFGYTRRAQSVSNWGDICEMLRLPARQTRFKKQTVRIHPVFAPDGELWFPSHSAEILVLGDSFCNIYSLGGMGWGEGAGWCEQLSFALQRPVDSLINNAGGSHVTRERLAGELAHGRNRLRGKRVVVWQFAMRDLLFGDWKKVKLPEPKS